VLTAAAAGFAAAGPFRASLRRGSVVIFFHTSFAWFVIKVETELSVVTIRCFYTLCLNPP